MTEDTFEEFDDEADDGPQTTIISALYEEDGEAPVVWADLESGGSIAWPVVAFNHEGQPLVRSFDGDLVSPAQATSEREWRERVMEPMTVERHQQLAKQLGKWVAKMDALAGELGCLARSGHDDTLKACRVAMHHVSMLEIALSDMMMEDHPTENFPYTFAGIGAHGH
jgi:hypothetical protein